MRIEMRNLSIAQWSILLIPHTTMYDRILITAVVRLTKTLDHNNGRVLTKDLSFELTRGEHLFVEGALGIGKSILLHAIAGIRPYGSLSITMPRGDAMLFLPQKSYLPMGILRGHASLSYS